MKVVGSAIRLNLKFDWRLLFSSNRLKDVIVFFQIHWLFTVHVYKMLSSAELNV